MTNWEAVSIWIYMVASGLMAVVEAGTFYKMWTGARYKVILWILAFSIAGNIAFLLYAVTNLMWAVKGESLAFWGTLLGVTNSLGSLLFGEAHWLLAFYYMKIAKNMPRIIDGHNDKVKSYKAIWWIGVGFNAIFPVIMCPVYIIETKASVSDE